MKENILYRNIFPPTPPMKKTTPSRSELFAAPNLSSSFVARLLAGGADQLSCDWPEVPLWYRLPSTQFCCIACGWILDGVAAAGEVFTVHVFVFLFVSHPPLQLHGWVRDESRQEAAERSLLFLLFSPLISAERFYMRAVIQKYYSLPAEHSRVWP